MSTVHIFDGNILSPKTLLGLNRVRQSDVTKCERVYVIKLLPLKNYNKVFSFYSQANLLFDYIMSQPV